MNRQENAPTPPGQTGILISFSPPIPDEDPGALPPRAAPSCMGFLLVLPVRCLLLVLRRLPLPLVARLGRALGTVGWWILRRHRRVALENLSAAFAAERSPRELRALALENFRRLGENYLCGARTATMTDAELRGVLTVRGQEHIPHGSPTTNLVVATGHFGNFELCARVGEHLPGWEIASTYRALKPPALDRLLQELRAHSGIRLFERTRDAQALRHLLARGGIAVGLLADQHGGPRGLWVPFFGRPCSTNASPAILAQRYQSDIYLALCFRTGLGRWEVEFGPGVPTRDATGAPRDQSIVMTELNARYEAAVRRDPANWFWVHRRWKPPTPQQLARAQTQASGEAAPITPHQP